MEEISDFLEPRKLEEVTDFLKERTVMEPVSDFLMDRNNIPEEGAPQLLGNTDTVGEVVSDIGAPPSVMLDNLENPSISNVAINEYFVIAYKTRYDILVEQITIIYEKLNKEPQYDIVQIETLESKLQSYISEINILSTTSQNDSKIPKDLWLYPPDRLIQKALNSLSQKYPKGILYPPEFVFPRNPSLIHWIKPQEIIEVYKEDESELKFEFGFSGKLNIIRTKYAPYLDRKYYNFKDKTWYKPQLVLTIQNNPNVVDVTPYFINSIINFSGDATGINDEIVYYFDGSKINTNYDFRNVEDRKKVTIKYYKIANSLRVKAVLKTNLSHVSFYTPTVDQYTLLVDKQRVIN